MTKSVGAISFTLLTLILPLIAAILSFPHLIATLGIERFGYLGIFWVLIGYFSIFDLGLGRVMTREVSLCLARGRTDRLRPTVLYLMRVMLVLSAGGMVSVLLLAESPAVALLPAGTLPTQELVAALRWLALGVPAVILFAAARGLLEALGFFSTAATLRAVVGTWTFAGPVLAAGADTSLAAAMQAIVLFRIAVLSVPFVLLYRVARLRGYLRSAERTQPRGLLRMAGWVSVSNVVSPLLVYIDRFLLAGMAGPTAVALYSAPFDILSRLSVFPEAIFSVLFPKIAGYHASRPGSLFAAHHAVERVLLAFITIVAALAVLAGDRVLSVWLGPEFAKGSWQVLLLLVAGLVPNFTARAAFTTLQAAGHARDVAIVHLMELPVYLVAAVTLIAGFGLTGAAAAWGLRSFVDFLLLRRIMGRRIGTQLRHWRIDLAVTAIAATVAASAFVADPGLRAVMGGGLLLAVTVATAVWVPKVWQGGGGGDRDG